jgi:hypothetical protein
MTWTELLTHLGLPVCGLLALALLPMRRRVRTLWAVALLTLLLAAERVFLWHVPPIWVAWGWIALLPVAVSVGWRRTPAAPPGRVPGMAALLSSAGAALFGVALLGALLGDDAGPPDGLPVIDLAAPLAEGRYLVAHGGASGYLNAHTAFVASHPRGAKFAGQAFALDLLGMGALWLTGPLFGAGPITDYPITGTPVLAPCAGQVVTAQDGLPDMPPPQRDRARLTGNHVLLRCGDVEVLLAHLRQGTVAVRTGDRVETGAQLGAVGNSGNTTQPHLHLHVQRPGTAEAPLSGQALPFTIDGRWLVRNDRLVLR